MHLKRVLTVTTTAAAALAILAGCAADGAPGPDASGPASGTTLPARAASVDDMALLPDDIKKAGSIKAATTDGMAPWVYVDGDTQEVMGVDADLLNEAASRLGLTIEWDDIQFTAALPGVQSGRYDLYVSAMADRLDREEVVNFIDYSVEGSGIVVPKGNPDNITSFASLCGLKVNYLTGSLFPDLVSTLNDTECEGNPIDAYETPDKQATYLAVASGQSAATFDTYGVSNYAFQTASAGEALELELAPVKPFAPARQGIAFSKESSDLQLAIAGALQQMVEDGTYQEILDKWAVGDLALDEILINSPLSSELTDFLE